jgi:hypothetical protein
MGDRVCVYDGKEDRGWTERVAEFRQERARDGSFVTLVGQCPHCCHDMSVALAVRARTGTRVGPDRVGQPLGRDGERQFVKVAYCNCETAHDKRPDDVQRGCGRFGALLVGEATQPYVRFPTIMRPFVSIRPSARKAAVTDVQWERRADEEAAQTLSNTRAAAEKWTAAVASLTGIFSIALVVKGPEDVTKIDGEVVDLSVFGWITIVGLLAASGLLVLVAVTRQQRKGVFIVAAVLAALALASALASWVSTWSLFVATMALLGVAVTCAAIAILAGARAAYGRPSGAPASGTILRERQDHQARQARWLLRVQLRAVSASMLAIAGAIAITWTSTDAPPGDKLLVLTNAGSRCGELLSSSSPGKLADRLLVLLEDGQTQPISIPSSDVVSVVAVSSCERT